MKENNLNLLTLKDLRKILRESTVSSLLMTRKDVMSYLHIGSTTLYKLTKNRLLKPKMIGNKYLYPREEVNKLLKQYK